jgi:catechol 2,3-dioxygenase-like lactoylglutathione lyase family enzyme
VLAIVERLVTQYESGRLNRRDLLGALAMLAASPSLVFGPSSLFRAAELNHVTLRSRDLARSKEFYQRLLGLRVVKEEKDLCYLDSGRGFLCLWQAGGPTAGCDHLCFGVEKFDRRRAFATLQANGISLRRDPDDPDTIYVLGPDEVPVQLEAQGYKG